MVDLGFNYRLTDIQCALGIAQLKRIEANLARRKAIAKRYDEAFKGTAVRTILPPASVSHAYHLYIIRVQNRKQVYEYLRHYEVHAQVHYIPTHLLSYYSRLGWGPGSCPHAETYYAHCLSIPMYPGLTDEQQDFVIRKILDIAQ
jgi:dTDP-4-amino-4,6-dideoxygalactose transaminase